MSKEKTSDVGKIRVVNVPPPYGVDRLVVLPHVSRCPLLEPPRSVGSTPRAGLWSPTPAELEELLQAEQRRRENLRDQQLAEARRTRQPLYPIRTLIAGKYPEASGYPPNPPRKE